MCKKLSVATEYLENVYDLMNEVYFENALPKVVITIQSTPIAYGHYTTREIWQEKKCSYHEINFGAETLNRKPEQIAGTMIHEMVHHFCNINDIQDTSRGGTYHNKRFKIECEKRGLQIEYNHKIGWSITTPTLDVKQHLKTAKLYKSLDIFRDTSFGSDTKTKKKSSTRKYICPCCGNSVRATKDVNIMCIDCNEIMVTAS